MLNIKYLNEESVIKRKSLDYDQLLNVMETSKIYVGTVDVNPEFAGQTLIFIKINDRSIITFSPTGAYVVNVTGPINLTSLRQVSIANVDLNIAKVLL